MNSRDFDRYGNRADGEAAQKMREHYRKAREIAQLASNLAKASGEDGDKLRVHEAWGRVAGIRETAGIMGVTL